MMDSKDVVKQLGRIQRRKITDNRSVLVFLFNESKRYDDTTWFSAFCPENIDDLPGELMEQSLSKTISRFKYRHGESHHILDILLKESPDHSTNIDADVIEKLMGMLI